MTAKKTLFLLLLLPLLVGSLSLRGIPSAYAEGPVLKQTANEITIDGIVGPGEYTFLYDFKQLSLRLNRTSERLYAAVTAETGGWVGVGLNSSKMNKADIIIGYFSKGKAVIKEQRGFGNKHKDNKIPYVVSYAINETSGKTAGSVHSEALRGALYPGGGRASGEIGGDHQGQLLSSDQEVAGILETLRRRRGMN